MFSLFFVLNLLLWAKDSSAAVPFTTLLALLAMMLALVLRALALGLGVARCRSTSCVVPLSRPALQKLEGLTADEAASQVSTGGSASTSTPSQRRGRVAEPPVP